MRNVKYLRSSQKKKTLRPTSSKVKEAVFDILRMHMKDVRFLDLYAGTGAVGIDALREGASEVVLVEESRSASRDIEKLILKKGVSGNARVITKRVLSFIENADPEILPFDIVFLDPPYHSDEILNALSAIGRTDIVKPGGMVMAEHFTKRILPDSFERLIKEKDYAYGDTVLSVYRCK